MVRVTQTCSLHVVFPAGVVSAIKSSMRKLSKQVNTGERSWIDSAITDSAVEECTWDTCL